MAVNFENIPEYKGNPVKYAQEIMGEADKMYDLHKKDIDTARDHLLLKSDHLAQRQAIGDRSAHYLPEITPAIRARAAQIFDIFVSQTPPLRLTASNADIPGARDSASRLEKWLNGCYETRNLWLEWFLAFFAAETWPYSTVYLRWHDKWGTMPYIDKMGGLSYEDLITYSGPVVEILPPDDYRGDLYARHKSDMRFHNRMKECSDGYLRAGARRGDYPYLDPNDLSKCKSGEWLEERRKNRFGKEYQKPKGYDNEKIEAYVKVYDEESDQDVWRIIEYCGEQLLDERPWPLDGAPFFLLNSFPLPGEIAALSTAILGEANQNATNELWNQMIEGNEQALWSPTAYKGNMTSDPVWEPMALWQMDDPGSLKKLVEPRMVGDILASIGKLEERNQNNLAAWDVLQPTGGQSKQTAREYVGKEQNYSKIIGVNLQFYGADIISCNKMIVDMARQHLPDWVSVGLLGGANLSQLKMQDLATDVNIEIPNVRQLSMMEMEMYKWDTMYDKMMGNPIIAMNLQYVHELTKRYLIAHQEEDIAQLIGEQAPQIPMMAPAMNAPA